MIGKHRCQRVGHHMRYMAAGRQGRVVIIHRHMSNTCASGGPQPLHSLECRCVGLARRCQNHLAPVKQLRVGRPDTAVFATCDGMTGNKPWVVGARSLCNDPFDAGHIRDHGFA